MSRRLLVIAACLLGLVVPSTAGAQLSEHSLLAPGITYERDVEFTLHGPVVLHVVTAPRPDGSLYSLVPALSNNAVVATEPLTTLEKSLSAQTTAVGVNGDYFNANPGVPKGILMQNGVLVTPPPSDRSSLGIAPDGTLQVARVAFTGIWSGTGQRRSLTVNEPSTGAATTLYTPAWGPATPPESGPVVEDVLPSLPPTRPNTDLFGTVSQSVTSGGVPIPSGGAVLVARRSQTPILAREAPAGTTLFLRLALTPDWSGMAAAIGGGPVIVANGKPVFRANEAFPPSLLNVRGPRSAVGQLADGRIVLVTADGGGGGYSVGMTNFELALALMRLGAVQAMALGSGAATAMAFDGTLLNVPAATRVPVVSDALLLRYDGVYVPPPAASVISPNGDGVDESASLSYKVVRPSSVTATVRGPGGTLVLGRGFVQPGVHSFTFDGRAGDGSLLPEGGYRFDVAATDDFGRSSSAERGFAINDTLGSLAVSPSTALLSRAGSVALTVSFALARDATVRVTVEKPSGLVVRTLEAAQLPTGPQTVVWDGRGANGALALPGAYVVRVQAANSVGRVVLTKRFSAVRG